jgi:hypothetical protein
MRCVVLVRLCLRRDTSFSRAEVSNCESFSGGYCMSVKVRLERQNGKRVFVVLAWRNGTWVPIYRVRAHSDARKIAAHLDKCQTCRAVAFQ